MALNGDAGATAEVYSALLGPEGPFPNNPRVPLLVYRRVFRGGRGGSIDPAEIETLFESNGWSDGWRNGIFAYHHYHSSSPEVLGCYSGRARVLLGGDSGVEAEFAAGDVIVIPPGVAHKNLGASGDFRCVGAYPDGLSPDLMLCRPEELAAARRRIAAVPLPRNDPVFGAAGPAAGAQAGP